MSKQTLASQRAARLNRDRKLATGIERRATEEDTRRADSRCLRETVTLIPDSNWTATQSGGDVAQAEVVFDPFHGVAKYGREVIGRVRVDQANQLRQDRPARRVIKSSRWMLLRNRNNLDPAQAVQLDQLLEANKPLPTAYLMRDELKRFRLYPRPGWARRAWDNGCQQAEKSGIAALVVFARRLKSHLHRILSRCRHPLHASIVEGINNTIKVIKRRAYGYVIRSISF